MATQTPISPSASDERPRQETTGGAQTLLNRVTSAFGCPTLKDPNRGQRSLSKQVYDSFESFGIRHLLTTTAMERVFPQASQTVHHGMKQYLKVLAEKEEWLKSCRSTLESTRMGAHIPRDCGANLTGKALAQYKFGWYLNAAKEIRHGNYGALLPSREALTGYLKTGILGNHGSSLMRFLADGKNMFGALGQAVYLGATVKNMVCASREASEKAEARGEDTTTAAVKTGARELVTFLGSYEVGALGFTHFGALAACVTPAAPVVLGASLLGAALFGTIGKNIIRKGFDALFGNADDDSETA